MLRFIKHHQPNISIHITANTLPIKSRRGSGNNPHVFLAQGVAGSSVRIAHIVPTDDGSEAAHNPSSALSDQGPFMITKTQIDRWNRPDAFQKFLQREAERERALQRYPTSPEPQLSISPVRHRVVEPTPGASQTPTIPLSDDSAFPPSEGASELSDASTCSASAYSDSAIFPFSFSAITPYPAHPLHRKRVQRAERRMARLTKNGLVGMLSSDEEDAKNSKQKSKEKDEDVVEKMEIRKERDQASMKENMRTYVHRPIKAYMRGGKVGCDSYKASASRVNMDIIEWTPESRDEERYTRGSCGSVEI
jgi:hypothetical protein